MTETDINANGVIIPQGASGAVPSEEEVNICMEFLRQCLRTKRGRAYSYGLKHVIQRWAGKYVSNGATIAAAIRLGLTTTHERGGPNCWIGVRVRSIEKLSGTPWCAVPVVASEEPKDGSSEAV